MRRRCRFRNSNMMLKKSLTMYAAKLTGYGLRLFLPYFLVRILTKADFGAYRQFFLVEVTIASVFQLGINQALYYFIPRDEKNAGAYLLNSMLLNLLVYTCAFTLIGLNAERLSDILNMPLIQEYFWQLVGYTLALMLILSADCYLAARQHVTAAAAFQIINPIVVGAATLIAAYTSRDLRTLFTVMTIAALFNFCVMAVFIHLRIRGFRAERYFFAVWEQIKYGVVLGLGGTMWVLQPRIHEFFVSRYYGQEVFALYSAGCTQIPIVEFYLHSVAVVCLGQFAVMEKNGDWEGIIALWRKVMTSLFGIAIPGIVFLLAVSKPLIIFMFTEDYAGAVDIFRVNTLIKLSMLWNAQLVLRAMNRNEVVFYVLFGAFVATPFVLYAFMQAMGLQGVIWGQFLVMMASRLGIQCAANRLVPSKLPYFVSVGEIRDFYRSNARKALDFARVRLSGSR